MGKYSPVPPVNKKVNILQNLCEICETCFVKLCGKVSNPIMTNEPKVMFKCTKQKITPLVLFFLKSEVEKIYILCQLLG